MPFLLFLVFEIQIYPDQVIQCKGCVREGENPACGCDAIGRKTDRGGELAYEEEF